MQLSTNRSDSQLIQAFHAGESAALEELVLRHNDRVFTSILFLVKDRFLAEDLFQDVFIKIIDTIKGRRYNDEGKFVSWAMRIAHNLCVDHFRRIKRTPTVINTEGRDVFEWLQFGEEGADAKMMRRQSHARVQKMLEHLPEEQREVIVLRHYANLSFKEIAEITNCSINTALGRMRYGLINLRKLMAEKQIAL